MKPNLKFTGSTIYVLFKIKSEAGIIMPTPRVFTNYPDALTAAEGISNKNEWAIMNTQAEAT